jgi:hypothetical protein
VVEPRLFRLGLADRSGATADGVQWPDGSVSVRWHPPQAMTGTYACLVDVELIHGRSTRITWADQPAPPPPRRPSAVPDSHPLDGIGDLARALGGDESSWTGQALLLIAKSDPERRKQLAAGIKHLIMAYEIWMTMTDTSLRGTPTAGEFLPVYDAARTAT